MFTPSLKARIVSKIVMELQIQANDSIPTSTRSTEKNRSDITNLRVFKKLFDFDEEHGFGKQNVPSTAALTAETLFNNYLFNDEKSISSLEKFPEIGKLFIKANTPLCSSGSSERLFSIAKHIFKASRCRLSDENFESQLLLKVNKN